MTKKTSRRTPAFLALVVAGCSAASSQETAAPVADPAAEFRVQMAAEMATVESLAVVVERSIDETTARIDRMEALETELRNQLAVALTRPAEIRTEIVGEVDAKTAAAFERLATDGRVIEGLLADADSTLDRTLRTEFGKMRADLAADAALVRFFYGEQKTLNGELNTRLNDKRWYDSIVGPRAEETAP